MRSEQRLLEMAAALVIACALFNVHVYAGENKWGQYVGVIVAKFLDDGRNMRIEQPFKYIDPHALEWDVPVGTVTDGASVPRFFWVMFAPFTGKYRAAAIVHDRFCQIRSRGWRQTSIKYLTKEGGRVFRTFRSAFRIAGMTRLEPMLPWRLPVADRIASARIGSRVLVRSAGDPTQSPDHGWPPCFFRRTSTSQKVWPVDLRIASFPV